ncbi:hypothetical protein N7532_010005 [Penicillium argentinense]|uniref:OPA3-like protein n=1 Tax=Penicillium argentinense TaxID=1131581 RepID=A0A9W9ENZ9_9EURO|nr:uncharacterized protein N7532_010005 [Penicillium argentinense]KAJ5085234.1 hypothetical protein N7532_010005 [Penicillium argentinense]
MSLTLKISSLVIRTLSKPIANQIKAQAREHERFRNVCVSMAQALHRFDMRLRLGSIRDTTASRKQAAAEAEAKRHVPKKPTVKTEAATKAEQEALDKAKAAAEEAAKPQHYRIRPLSESKAIESGANFISETFLFLVAGGLIVFESWRSRQKESTRREGVEDRLVALEKKLSLYEEKHGKLDVEQEEQKPRAEESLWTRLTSYISFGQEPSLSQQNTAAAMGSPKESPQTNDSKTGVPKPAEQPTPTPAPQQESSTQKS